MGIFPSIICTSALLLSDTEEEIIVGQSTYTMTDNKRFDWKLLGLSILVYYIIVMSINIILSFVEVEYKQYKFYSLVASVIAAIYFYQTRKEKGVRKKDLIWVGIVGVIVATLMILSYF